MSDRPKSRPSGDAPPERSPAADLFARLLVLYPPAYRRRFGDSMRSAFAAEHERVAALGLGRRARFWMTTLAYVLVGAALEWLGALRAHVTGRLPAWRADLRTAASAPLRRPGHALLVVSTVGAGIASTTAIFATVNAMHFAPLPFRDAPTLVQVREILGRPGPGVSGNTPSPRTLTVLREGFGPFERTAGHAYRMFGLTSRDDATLIRGTTVTDDWLETLAIAPALGRGFSPEEQALGDDARVALIGDGVWTRLFGRDPAAVGSTVGIDGVPHEVIGVMPVGFRFPWGSEAWVMGRWEPTDPRSGLGVVARVRPDLDRDAAREALRAYSTVAAERFPDTHANRTLDFITMREYLVGNRAGTGLLLLIAVGLLLLLTCVNVAGVSTVRVTARRPELAARMSLGAGRGDLFRLVLAEGSFLCALGGALGLALVPTMASVVARVGSASESGIGLVFPAPPLDARVMGFALLALAASAAVLGLLPALRAASLPLRGAPRRGDARRRVEDGVVAAETALACTLLLVAALVVGSYRSLTDVDRGYSADGRYAVQISLSDGIAPTTAEKMALLGALEERLESTPGVLAAGYTHHLPTTPGRWMRSYSVEHGLATEGERRLQANARWIGGAYLAALGVRMVEGRAFTADELNEERPVVIVSESFARRHWPGGSALGGRVKLGELDDDLPWYEVVGVGADVHEDWDLAETLYLPFSTRPQDWVELVVAGSPAFAPGRLREAVREVDARQPADVLRALGVLAAEEIESERVGTGIVGAFALVGLLLFGLGTYGTVALAATRRERELGVRMALGGRPGALTRRMVARGVRVVAAGALVGALATRVLLEPLREALGASGVIHVQLLRAGTDPVGAGTVAAVVSVAVLVGAVASWLPARRAMRRDLTRALRAD